MRSLPRNLFAIMPFLFGLGFIAPLLVQTRAAAVLAGPVQADPTVLALALGGAWGLYACLTGRWL